MMTKISQKVLDPADVAPAEDVSDDPEQQHEPGDPDEEDEQRQKTSGNG